MRTIVIAEWGFLCSTNYNTSLIYCSLIFHSIYKKKKLESGKNSHLVPRLIKEHTEDCSDSHLCYLKHFHLISRLNLLSLIFWLLFLYLRYITEIPCPKEELSSHHPQIISCQDMFGCVFQCFVIFEVISKPSPVYQNCGKGAGPLAAVSFVLDRTQRELVLCLYV